MVAACEDFVIRNYALTRVSEESRLTVADEMTEHTARTKGLALLDDGRTLYSISDDKTLKRWTAASVPARLDLSGHEGPVRFHESMGFEHGEVADYAGPGRNRAVFVKEL